MYTTSQRSAGRARLLRLLGAMSLIASLALGVGATAASAALDPNNGFDPSGTNTFTDEDTLSPQCPNALAGTPGSDPAEKVLDTALNTAASFLPGGTVYYKYLDNPRNAASNFELQDCVVSYPAGKFTAADLGPNGEVTNASKQDLTSDATPIDSATLTGVADSTGPITFKWTSPGTLTPGSWVCNFARDISTGHGGDGNRKVSPTCYQVGSTTTTVDRPTITTTDPCGAGNATVTIPTTTGVTFHDGTAAGAVLAQNVAHPVGAGLTIVGVADNGYVLGAPTQNGNWEFGPFTETNTTACPSIAKPTITPDRPCGPSNDTVLIPSTAGVEYRNGATVVNGQRLTIPPGGLTIVATASGATPLANPDPGTTPPSWTFTFGADQNVDCGGGGGGGSSTPEPQLEEADPANPRVARTCDEADEYVIPDRDGVIYRVDGDVVEAGRYELPEGETVEITAEAAPGFELADGEADSWFFTGEPVEACPTEPEPILPFTPEPLPAQVETPPAAAPAAPVLAFTGLETRTMFMAAMTLLGIGLALVIASKRELRVK
jgi:hypothetical protein